MAEMNDEYCCEEFQSASDVTFANAIDGATSWLLYGTDYDSVSSGQPELRYWPIRFCPFCGKALEPAKSLPPRGRRQFGR